jgi:hypothetical protein
MVREESRAESPIRIETEGMSKQELADLLSAIFQMRAELKESGLKMTIKRKKPNPKWKMM